ncbi:hypothetical protein NKH55_21785 [Mesorhizobium opportunistum]|uniref:hypothetical protein n=1 Tax=Mesorhizobium opportunistum TaxID=593909 RepID=UPI0033388A25
MITAASHRKTRFLPTACLSPHGANDPICPHVSNRRADFRQGLVGQGRTLVGLARRLFAYEAMDGDWLTKSAERGLSAALTPTSASRLMSVLDDHFAVA